MIDDCVLYGRITVGFTTFFMLQNVFQSFLATAEKPKLGLAEAYQNEARNKTAP